MRMMRTLPFVMAAIFVMIGGGRILAGEQPPAVDQRFAAVTVGGELRLTGAGFSTAADPGAVRFDYDGTATTVPSDSTLVATWTDDEIRVRMPVEVRTGTVTVIARGSESAPLDLLVFEYVSYPLQSSPTASEFPLTLDRDASGRLWVEEEAQSFLKWFIPATATAPAATGRVSIPQVMGAGIFATERDGAVVRTRLSGRGEDIVVDGAGDVWFTQGGGGYIGDVGAVHNVSRVVRYTPSTGAFACYASPRDNAAIVGVLVDEERGRVWYTSEPDGSIWWFDPTTAPSNCFWDPYTQTWPQECAMGETGACHTRISIPGYYPSPAHLVAGPDGALWFTQYWGSAIGRYEPDTGSFTTIPLPAQIVQTWPGWFVGSGPWELEFDATGALWVSEFFDGSLVRVRVADMATNDCTALVEGQNACIDEVFVGSDGNDLRTLHSVTVGVNGYVWFSHDGSIGLVSPSHGNAVAVIELPEAGSAFGGLVSDPDTGGVWFTQFTAKRLGTLRPAVGDADGTDDVIDNCPGIYNPGQENADGDRIDLSAFGRPFDDVTWPNSDESGDICDDEADNDGLADGRELSLPDAGCPSASGPTDPLDWDTDDDTVLDGAECLMGTDPTDPGSKPARPLVNDPDHDWLPTWLEAVLGSDPFLADTDGDGIVDGVEVMAYWADPTVIDSDGDGCSDGVEAGSVNADWRVSSGDQIMVASAYGPGSSAAYVPLFDVNRDGAINSGDMLILGITYGGC